MNNLQKFIEKQSKKNTPVGDLARDILADPAIPDIPEENELFEYLEKATWGKVSSEPFQDFKKLYYSTNH